MMQEQGKGKGGVDLRLGNFFFAKLRSLFEYRIDDIRARLLAAGQVGETTLGVEQLMQNELHIANGSFVNCHGVGSAIHILG